MSKDLEILKKIEKKIGKKLYKLEKIDFESEDVGYVIDENKNIIGLSLCSIQISDISSLKDLKNLTNLNLSVNPILDYSSLKDLKNLTNLDLSYNNNQDLSYLKGLKNLKYLNLHWFDLSDISFLKDLKKLTHLDLSLNRIIDISFLKDLKNLTNLDLRTNKISDISSLKDLKNLIELNLSKNQISDISYLKGLMNLTDLDLSNNQISGIPQEITQFKKLENLYLENNPLKQPPPEIANKGIKAIFKYLSKIPKEIVNEAKLLLVGQGDVGKTCLAKRLIFNKFQKEKSTEGIDIFKWNINAPTIEKENIKLNVWDFGGQEIYHATHQFFLTKRSVYFLVWNARKTKDYEHIYYWLHTIEAFGEDSPIILVMSKWKERDDDLNMKDLREKFPQIIGLSVVGNPPY